MDPLEALAEPARRRILDILASGEHAAGQIADVVGYAGRAPRRGERGRQTTFTLSADPDTGLYPVYPIPDRAAFDVGDQRHDDPPTLEP